MNNPDVKRIGIAEVGSRSIRLMVADFQVDGSFKSLKTNSQLHGVNIDDISQEDLVGLFATLDRYRIEIVNCNCDTIMIYGTALCRKIAQHFPMSVPNYLQVLTIEDEARASWAAGFMCVRAPALNKRITVIDQGGGSTEIVTSTWTMTGLTNFSLDTLDIGTQRIMNIYLRSGAAFVNALNSLVSSQSELLQRHLSRENSELYFLGSVATKLAWLEVRKSNTEQYQPHRVNGVALDVRNTFNFRTKLVNLLHQNPENARLAIDVRVGNEDEALRIISGSAYLLLLSVKLGYETVKVSGYGTRHGMAFLALNGLI